MGDQKITEAINKLFANLTETEIPWNILHQYMPIQYNKVRDGKLALDPRSLAKDGVVQFMEDYEYAVKEGE